MLALSSSMTEGKIVKWVKSKGDKLSKGESVVVVESDKADMDVESFYDEYLVSIIVEEGLFTPVGSPIALLDESKDEIALAKLQTPSSSTVADAVSEKDTATNNNNDGVASVKVSTTSFTAVDLRSIKVGSAVHLTSKEGKRVVASPYAKKLAKELGLDLSGVVGSGPNGRVVAKDVEATANVSAGGIMGKRVSVTNYLIDL